MRNTVSKSSTFTNSLDCILKRCDTLHRRFDVMNHRSWETRCHNPAPSTIFEIVFLKDVTHCTNVSMKWPASILRLLVRLFPVTCVAYASAVKPNSLTVTTFLFNGTNLRRTRRQNSEKLSSSVWIPSYRRYENLKCSLCNLIGVVEGIYINDVMELMGIKLYRYSTINDTMTFPMWVAILNISAVWR